MFFFLQQLHSLHINFLTVKHEAYQKVQHLLNMSSKNEKKNLQSKLVTGRFISMQMFFWGGVIMSNMQGTHYIKWVLLILFFKSFFNIRSSCRRGACAMCRLRARSSLPGQWHHLQRGLARAQQRDYQLWQLSVRYAHCFPVYYHGRLDRCSLLGNLI